MTEVQLIPLETSDREQFIRDNQEAFNYGALEEFGQRDDHFEEDGEIISHDTISHAIDEGAAYVLTTELCKITQRKVHVLINSDTERLSL